MAKVPPPKNNNKSTKKPAVVRVPPPLQEASANLSKPLDEDEVGLNITVPRAFRKKFKNYATDHDMTMFALLSDMFEVYVKQKGE